MHTAEAARGRGIGRAMVAHLISVARDRGFGRVSLKTGSQPAFAPARSLYTNAGFTPCGPFGDYGPSRHSTFMTLSLGGPDLAEWPACGDDSHRTAASPPGRVQAAVAQPAGLSRSRQA
jgi:hypothetical protein